MRIGTLELTFEILNVLLFMLTDFGHFGIEPSYNPIYVFIWGSGDLGHCSLHLSLLMHIHR